MSEPQNKPLLLALGAAGSLLLAISSRRSKRKAAQERRERCRAAQEAAQIIIDETSRQSTTNRNQNASRHFGIRGQSRHLGIGGAPLLIHGLLSLIILYTLPYWQHWQPVNVSLQSAYQETIALTLVAFLTLHILIAFFAPTLFPSRHLQLASTTVTTADASTGIARPESILELNGVWTKDKEESDSMDPVCDLMQLPRLTRLAVGMISGVEIITDPTDSFQLNVLSGIMWFKIKEKYSLSGEEARHRRRDFRGGGDFGRAKEAIEGGIEVRHRFPDGVMHGTMVERFYCPHPNELRVDTFLEVPARGPGISYRQIYRKI